MKIFVFTILLAVALTSSAFAGDVKYTCPMHPNYISDSPGTCPICGMDLVLLEADEPSVTHSADSHDNHEDGRKVVTISPETIQNTGIRTETAKKVSFGNHIRSYGNVTEDIRLQFDIAGRVEGWIGNLNVQAVGDTVKKGDTLFTLYSPVLVSAQRDYVSAVQSGIRGRMESGKKRLAALGMQDSVIARLKKSHKPFENVPFVAEVDGVVSAIAIRDGSYVKPGMTLISLQDYSSVWVDANIAEKDIPYVTDKTVATVSFPTLGIKDEKAAIDYIYPTVDKTTRTGRVRLVLGNPNGTLKPGMYADVMFENDVQPRLSVPSESILKSKKGDYVVVALKEGHFQPRLIQTGLHYKNRTEVLKGLDENDNVVVSGQFLIDSESTLRDAFNTMHSSHGGEHAQH